MFYTERKATKFHRRFIGIYAVIIIAGLAFVGGLYVGAQRMTINPSRADQGGEVKDKDEVPPYLLQDVDFDLFWDVWNLTKERYLEQPVFDTRLFYGAVSGIVASLGDPFSAFLDPETTRKFNDELAGTFEGIGAEIGIRNGQLVVVAPLPDSPASRAGLQTGDQILKIDDKDTLGMPLDVAVSNIRGFKGSTVVLIMFREGWDEPREIPIVRDTINVKSVQWEKREGDLMYLKLIYFNENTGELFEEAVQQALSSGVKGIILDLRNNPGGFLEMAVHIASQWIPDGQVVVIQEFRGGRQDAFRARGQARLQGIPTAVLINDGSASASEIVAGALRDHGAATLVGEKSFGKGSVQTFEQLRGGSSLKLTVAHWLTPNGHQINGEGVTPDIEVEMTEEDVEADRDTQLDKAVELLTKSNSTIFPSPGLRPPSP